MKIGDYVRTKDGRIEKYSGTDDCEIENFSLPEIIKSSPNIIDLIEVGDYVNGMLVTEVSKLDSGSIEITYNDRYRYLYLKEWNYESRFNKFKIKSIVTKEQFESMEYRIKGE